MTYIFNDKPFFINILEYITAFLIILQCNSLFFPISSKMLLQLCIILLSLYGILNVTKYHKDLTNIFLFLILFFLFVSLFLIINLYIYHYKFINVFLILIDPMIFIIYLYSSLDKNHKINISIFIKIENIIIILAVISLIFWSLATIGMKPNTYLISNWTGQNQIVPGYYHLFYSSQGNIVFLGINILRNTGIYTEAPMYSYVLTFALLIELFIRKSKLLNYRNIILILTIITTASSTGIIVVLLSLSYSYFLRHKKNKQFIILLFIILVPILIVLLKIIIVDKIGTNTDLNSSFNIRMNDMVASWKTWQNHLIIGNGIDNRNSIIQNMGYWRLVPNGNVGLSTGFMSTIAYGGISLGMFYIIPTFLVMNISSKFKGMAIFSFILFIFTIISTSSLYILLLSYFWVNIIYYKLDTNDK